MWKAINVHVVTVGWLLHVVTVGWLLHVVTSYEWGDMCRLQGCAQSKSELVGCA